MDVSQNLEITTNRYVYAGVWLLIVLFILILFCLGLYFSKYIPYESKGAELQEPIKTREFIITRYNESLDWLLDDFVFNSINKPNTILIIYNKGSEFLTTELKEKYTIPIKVIPLENVGMCDHTVVHHIINNYSVLPDMTYFLPGTAFNDIKPGYARKLLENGDYYSYYFPAVRREQYIYDFTLENYINTGNRGIVNKINFVPCSDKPYGKWFEKLTKTSPYPIISFTGLFSIHREQILLHPTSFYNTLIEYVNKDTHTEAAHYLERAWYWIFTRPKYNSGVITIIKNEEMVIEEWINHYIWQGIEKLYIIDNGSTDNTKSIIEKYKNINYYYLPEKHKQVENYNSIFLKTAKKECKWIIVCDADEYIYERTGKTIQSYLNTLDYNKIGAIQLNWKMFGSNGYEKQPNDIRASFILRQKNLNSHTKQVVNTTKTEWLNVHHHGVYGDVIENPPELALNHYAIMSKEYFQKVKMTRGDVHNMGSENVRDMNYFNRYDHKEVEDTELRDIVLNY